MVLLFATIRARSLIRVGQHFRRRWNLTPCGVGIGVGSGRRNGSPPSLISQRISIALSSCVVLWQCSMNMPPQSRNCIVIVTAAARAQPVDVLAAPSPTPARWRRCRCAPGSAPPRSGCGSGDPSRRRRSSGSRPRACRISAPPRCGRSRRPACRPPFGARCPTRRRPTYAGSKVVWSAPRPNSNVARARATGIRERSGFGISVAGTWLLSGLTRVAHDAELQEPADARIERRRPRAPRPATGPSVPAVQLVLSGRVLGQVHQVRACRRSCSCEKSMTMS